MRSVFQNCADFVGIFDLHARSLYFNPAALSMLGIKGETTDAPFAKDLFAPEERDFVTNIAFPTAMRDGGWEGELTFVHFSTKTKIPVCLNLFRTDGSGLSVPEQCVAMGRVLTAQRAKDAALADATGRIQAVLNATEVGTWTYEIESDVVVADPNLQQLFGVSNADALGGRLESYLRAIHPDDRQRVEGQIGEALQNGSKFISEYRLQLPGGELKHVIARGSVERDAKGKAVRLPGVMLDVTNKVKAEQERNEMMEELQRQARTVEAMVSSIADFTYIFDRQGRFAFVNKPLLDLWGLDLKDAVGKNFYDLQYPADIACKLQRQIEEVFTTRQSLSDKTPYTSPTGHPGYYEYIFRPVFEKDGSVELVAGSTRDITKDKTAFDVLQKSEENFRSLAETLPDTVWVAGPNGGITWANSVLPKVTGVGLEEIIENGYRSLIHSDDLHSTLRTWATALDQGMPFEVQHRVRHADGSWKWHLVRGAPRLDEDGTIDRWIGTSTVIHEQLELHDRLKRSEALFRQLSDTIPQLAWMARPDGDIFWYNQRWYEYTGSTEDQMVGNGWQTVHDPGVLESVLVLWNASLESGSPFDMTFPIRGADGQFRPFLTRVMPLRDEEGVIQLWFGTNTDVSEQKRMLSEREELLESERAARTAAERAGRLKDEFLATLSHELRTPLNAIYGWTQILREEGGTDAKTLSEAIEVIDRNVAMQTQLIDDLLDMSRIISGKLRLDVQELDPSRCMISALESVIPAAQAKGIRLDRIIDPAAGPIFADAGRIQQIIWNLLSNAIKFTSRGGKISSSVSRVNSHIEISISDSGQGIAPEFLPHVFDRFRQEEGATNRKHGGLGLGLAIVKQLSELHGGSVHVASGGTGKGSTFTVKLPVVAVLNLFEEGERGHPKIGAAQKRMWKTDALEGLRVLVVDDETDARNLVKRLLEDCKAKVVTASSAMDALTQIRNSRPDILVSDIGMPVTDGYQFLRILKENEIEIGGKIPAIALTAFARSEDRTKAMLAGFSAHVSKPVEPSELIATIASIAGRTISA